MARKIEAWVTVPDKKFSILAMPEGTTGGLDAVFEAIAERRRLDRQEAGGTVTVVGLGDIVEGKTADVLPKCSSVCTMQARLLGADTGRAAACKLALRCAGIAYADPADSRAKERECRAHYNLAAEAFSGWVGRTAAGMAAAQAELVSATETIEAANARLDELL